MNTTITSGQLSKFLELLEQKQRTPERFQTRWGRLWKALSNYNVTGSFRFGVDYSLSLEQMIAFGNYDGKANPNIPTSAISATISLIHLEYHLF